MTEEQIKTELREGRVLVDFFATWCNPCKALSPILDKFAEETNEIKVIKIDIDQHHETASAFHVRGVPTLCYLEDGELVDTKTGVQSISSLRSLTKLD